MRLLRQAMQTIDEPGHWAKCNCRVHHWEASDPRARRPMMGDPGVFAAAAMPLARPHPPRYVQILRQRLADAESGYVGSSFGSNEGRVYRPSCLGPNRAAYDALYGRPRDDALCGWATGGETDEELASDGGDSQADSSAEADGEDADDDGLVSEDEQASSAEEEDAEAAEVRGCADEGAETEEESAATSEEEEDEEMVMMVEAQAVVEADDELEDDDDGDDDARQMRPMG